MINSQDIKKAYDKTYTELGSGVLWATEKWRDDGVNLMVDFVLKNNIPHSSLLDYGAGTGHFAVAFKDKLSIPKVVAADISEVAVDKRLLSQHGINFLQAAQPKEVGGKYDLILCWTVLMSFNPEQRKEFLAQFSKMLNEKGVLLIGTMSSRDKYFDGSEKKFSPYGIPMYAHSEQMFEDQTALDLIGLTPLVKGDLIHKLDDCHAQKMTVPERLLRYCFLQKQKEQSK